eukprot:1368154-Amorphochlora_amoeboformis.AAC.1
MAHVCFVRGWALSRLAKFVALAHDEKDSTRTAGRHTGTIRAVKIDGQVVTLFRDTVHIDIHRFPPYCLPKDILRLCPSHSFPFSGQGKCGFSIHWGLRRV